MFTVGVLYQSGQITTKNSVFPVRYLNVFDGGLGRGGSVCFINVETCRPFINYFKDLVFLPWHNFESEERCQHGVCRRVCAPV